MRDVKDAATARHNHRCSRFVCSTRRRGAEVFAAAEGDGRFHVTNLVTHYALAHPEISFTLTNNGRETIRVAPAKDLRERAYQIFGAQFLEGLLEVNSAVSEPGADGVPARAARVGWWMRRDQSQRTPSQRISCHRLRRSKGSFPLRASAALRATRSSFSSMAGSSATV